MGQNNTEIFLETLARDKQFKNAIETPIGIELFSELVLMLKDNLELVLANKDSEEIRAKVKVYREILIKWGKRINSATDKQLKFNQITGE